MLHPSIQRVVHLFLAILLIHNFTAHATTSTTTMTIEDTLEKNPCALTWPNRKIAVHKNGFFGIDEEGRVNSVDISGKVKVLEQIKDSADHIKCSANGTVLTTETFKGVTVYTQGKMIPTIIPRQKNAIVSSDGNVILTTTPTLLSNPLRYITLWIALGVLLLDQAYLLVIPLFLWIWAFMSKTIRAYGNTGTLLLEHNTNGTLWSTPSDLEKTTVIELRLPIRYTLLSPRKPKNIAPTNFTRLETSPNGLCTLYANLDAWRLVRETLTLGNPKYVARFPKLPFYARVLKVTDEGSIWYSSGAAVWLEDWSGKSTKEFDIHGELIKSSDNSTLVDAVWDHALHKYKLNFHYI